MTIEIKRVLSSKAGAVLVAMRRKKADSWHFWWPFPDHSLQAAFAIDDTTIFAMSTAEFALYDFGAQKVVRRSNNADAAGSEILVSRDKNRIYLYRDRPLRVVAFDTRDFCRLGAIDGVGNEALRAVPPLIERKDGRLEIHACEVTNKKRKFYGIELEMPKFTVKGTFVLDPKTWTVELSPATAKLGKSYDGLPGYIKGDAEAKIAAKEADKFVAAAICGATCVVRKFASVEIEEALSGLADRIRTRGFTDLVRSGQMIIQFEVAGKPTTEKAFFKRIADAKLVAVVPALRRLIAAYVAADAGFANTFYDSGAGIAAFAHPMRALLLLDPDGSREVFLDYLAKLDDGHAMQTWKLIFGDFVETNGLRSKDDIRLAIAVMLHELNAASGDGMWNGYKLLATARQLMTGAEFGAMVMTEMDAALERSKRFLDERWYKTHSHLDQSPKARKAFFAKQAIQTRDFDYDMECIIVPLLHDAPARDAFGRDLREFLSERWDIQE